MELVGVKAARFQLAILIFIQWVSSRTTTASEILGYVVEEGSPITTVSCTENTDGQMVVYTHSEFLFCDYPGSSRVGTACDIDGNVFYTDLQGSEDKDSCADDSPCISVTVVEDYSADSDDRATYTVVDCMDIIGLEAPVSTLYQKEPDLPSWFTESESPVSTIESEFPVSTTDSDPWNWPNKESDDKRKGGVSKVGIVLGAVFAGVGLIIAAIFLGNRIRRKKAESSEPGSQPRGFKGSGERLKSLSRPTVAVSRARRPKEAGRRQENLTMQPAGTNKAPAEMEVTSKNNPAEIEANSKNSLVEMEARIEENLRAELGTGKDAQGWAGGGTNAVPYELDATTPVDMETK